MGLQKVHNLARRDLLLKGFLQAVPCEHSNDEVLETVIFPHEETENRPVQEAVCVGVHFEVRLNDYELRVFGLGVALICSSRSDRCGCVAAGVGSMGVEEGLH